MRAVRSSSIVPGRPGDTVYLVLEGFGLIGQAYREADPGGDDEAYVIHNLITGQYSVMRGRYIEFNLLYDRAAPPSGSRPAAMWNRSSPGCRRW
jgi:hypothetical protein